MFDDYCDYFSDSEKLETLALYWAGLESLYELDCFCKANAKTKRTLDKLLVLKTFELITELSGISPLKPFRVKREESYYVSKMPSMIKAFNDFLTESKEGFAQEWLTAAELSKLDDFSKHYAQLCELKDNKYKRSDEPYLTQLKKEAQLVLEEMLKLKCRDGEKLHLEPSRLREALVAIAQLLPAQAPGIPYENINALAQKIHKLWRSKRNFLNNYRRARLECKFERVAANYNLPESFNPRLGHQLRPSGLEGLKQKLDQLLAEIKLPRVVQNDRAFAAKEVAEFFIESNAVESLRYAREFEEKVYIYSQKKAKRDGRAAARGVAWKDPFEQIPWRALVQLELAYLVQRALYSPIERVRFWMADVPRELALYNTNLLAPNLVPEGFCFQERSAEEWRRRLTLCEKYFDARERWYDEQSAKYKTFAANRASDECRNLKEKHKEELKRFNNEFLRAHRAER